MKRAFITILGLLFVAGISIYLFIPKQITITQTSINEASEMNVSRFLLHEKNWAKWWPGQTALNDDKLFIYNGRHYHFDHSTNSGVTVLVADKNSKFESRIAFWAEDNLKTRITWTAELYNGNNIIKKVERCIFAKKASQDIGIILQHLKIFLETEKNVYGFNIRLSKVKDPIMLATAVVTDKCPGVPFINAMIQKLHKQIKDQNGLETNYPMLNVNQTGKTQYQVMVAIPIDKELKPQPNTFINKMVLGNILVADVKGGPNTINSAFNELRTFIRDYRFTAPAMPFESMATNRSLEKDTSKWITKIYYPIF